MLPVHAGEMIRMTHPEVITFGLSPHIRLPHVPGESKFFFLPESVCHPWLLLAQPFPFKAGSIPNIPDYDTPAAPHRLPRVPQPPLRGRMCSRQWALSSPPCN